MKSLIRSLLMATCLFACGTKDDTPEEPTGDSDALVCMNKVTCIDPLILDLNLQTEKADGLITNTVDGGIWHTTVDATAGGAFAATPDSFVYAAFVDGGLLKVNYGDEEALESNRWDIAFRRFIIRLNSGVSGPGCTVATKLPAATDFANVVETPATAAFAAEAFFTAEPQCDLIDDGSDMDSPATVLSGYFQYALGNPGCVQMTGSVYIVRTLSGRHVKLEVTHFYNDTAQATCQSDPADFSTMGAGAANIQLRWAFL